ncbi:unnamed protein product, partial [Ectocarpus sp. 4 AP-2014]
RPIYCSDSPPTFRGETKTCSFFSFFLCLQALGCRAMSSQGRLSRPIKLPLLRASQNPCAALVVSFLARHRPDQPTSNERGVELFHSQFFPALSCSPPPTRRVAAGERKKETLGVL